MKSSIAVAAIMATVASAKPVADGWSPVYDSATTTVATSEYYPTTTEYPTSEAYPTTSEYPTSEYETTEYYTATSEYEASTTVYVSSVVYTTTCDEEVSYHTSYSMTGDSYYPTKTGDSYYPTTTKGPKEYPTTYYPKPTTSVGTWSEWEVSSIPYETTTKKTPTTTSWAVWTTSPSKNTSAPYPKYTGAASQQGVAVGAMAIAGIAMLL